MRLIDFLSAPRRDEFERARVCLVDCFGGVAARLARVYQRPGARCAARIHGTIVMRFAASVVAGGREG